MSRMRLTMAFLVAKCDIGVPWLSISIERQTFNLVPPGLPAYIYIYYRFKDNTIFFFIWD